MTDLGDERTDRQKANNPDSQAMLNRLKENQFPADGWETFLDPDIRNYFDELFFKTGLKRSTVIRNANISRTYGYQLMDGSRRGQRDYYISIALAMRLDLRMTQRLLAVTNTGGLHPLIKRDAAIIFAVNHGYDNDKLYAFLIELGLPPLDTGLEE
jgi:hypothetical protein